MSARVSISSAVKCDCCSRKLIKIDKIDSEAEMFSCMPKHKLNKKHENLFLSLASMRFAEIYIFFCEFEIETMIFLLHLNIEPCAMFIKSKSFLNLKDEK